jgi:hypoxanthine phosphoribosyltransferase
MKSEKVTNYSKVIRVPREGVEDTEGGRDERCLRDKQSRVESVLIPEACLKKRIAALGAEIARSYVGRDEVMMLVVLKGGFVFAADLGRAIYESGGPAVKYDFIRASTYGKDIKAHGEAERSVKIQSPTASVRGRDVLLVEDIVDQGFTLMRLRKYLLGDGRAKSVQICALLSKQLDNPAPEVREIRQKLKVDFIGFEVPDVWIAGYGVDAGEDFRFLPCIVAIDEDYYRWGGA